MLCPLDIVRAQIFHSMGLPLAQFRTLFPGARESQLNEALHADVGVPTRFNTPWKPGREKSLRLDVKNRMLFERFITEKKGAVPMRWLCWYFGATPDQAKQTLRNLNLTPAWREARRKESESWTKLFSVTTKIHGLRAADLIFLRLVAAELEITAAELASLELVPGLSPESVPQVLSASLPWLEGLEVTGRGSNLPADRVGIRDLALEQFLTAYPCQFRESAIARGLRMSQVAVYQTLLDLGFSPKAWLDGAKQASEARFLRACEKMSIQLGVPFDIATVCWAQILANRGMNASRIAACSDFPGSDIKIIEATLKVSLRLEKRTAEGWNRGHRLSTQAKVAIAQFLRKFGHLSSLTEVANFFGITASNVLVFTRRLKINPKIWKPAHASAESKSPDAFPGMTVSQVIHVNLAAKAFGWAAERMASNGIAGCDSAAAEKALTWKFPFLAAVHRPGKSSHSGLLSREAGEALDRYLRDFPCGAPIKKIARFFGVGSGTVRGRISAVGHDPKKWTRDCRQKRSAAYQAARHDVDTDQKLDRIEIVTVNAFSW